MILIDIGPAVPMKALKRRKVIIQIPKIQKIHDRQMKKGGT